VVEQSAAVIGAGPMGLWMAEHLRRNRFRIKIYDIDTSKRIPKKFICTRTLEEAVSETALAVVAVGSNNAGEVIKEILKLNTGTTAIDISSVKTPVIKSLREVRTGDGLIVLTHPLFGPGAKTLADKTVIFTPFKNKQGELRIARKVFHPCRIVTMDAATHDRLMAYSMASPRLLLLTLLNVWQKHGVKPLTTSQRALLIASSPILMEKPNVIEEIIAENPYTAKAALEIIQNIRSLTNNPAKQISKTLKKIKHKNQKTYETLYKLLEKHAANHFK